ncbi:protein of unknown function [Candidatus Methylocalor cossyra]|uniref:Uncharacterized protein n=1 Tax=Candidatus Methylocalor cossyra TaxID=3108543 RepID=A0ABM9NKF1_9GAMM
MGRSQQNFVKKQLNDTNSLLQNFYELFMTHENCLLRKHWEGNRATRSERDA